MENIVEVRICLVVQIDLNICCHLQTRLDPDHLSHEVCSPCPLSCSRVTGDRFAE
ncbi:hypothetical protein OG21DRAFT_1505667, partial [Imleria badia]